MNSAHNECLLFRYKMHVKRVTMNVVAGPCARGPCRQFSRQVGSRVEVSAQGSRLAPQLGNGRQLDLAEHLPSPELRIKCEK